MDRQGEGGQSTPRVGDDGCRNTFYGALGDDKSGAPPEGLGGEEGPVVPEAGDRDEGEARADGPGVVGHAGDGVDAPGHLRPEDTREVYRVEIHAG